MSEQVEISEMWHKLPVMTCTKCERRCDRLWSSVKFNEWLCEKCFEVKLKEYVDGNAQ